jgi:3-deoxy-D-manno-octulosonic-acid transferase
VVAGPHMFNFAEATRLAAQAGATVQTADAAHAIREALRLLEDAPSRERMAAAGRKLVEGHRGATQRHVDACLALLGASGG